MESSWWLGADASVAERPRRVMTRADRLCPPFTRARPAGMIRPDYPSVGRLRMHDLPAPLHFIPTFPFVGRTAELERLRALMPRADGEGRHVVLLGGEPGSGKSRLVRELAGEAAREGVCVLYGACDAVVRTPYGPFVEALDQLARTMEPAELRAALGSGGGELTRLLPDLDARVGRLPAAVKADPDTERHRLHTAVTDLLAGAASTRPALLVLEDVHWADAPTLLLLRHLARAGTMRVLLLATFRDTEADVPGVAVGDARRPAPLRRRPAPARRALRRRRRRVRPARRRRRARRGAARARRRDPRPHRGQRVPRLRALARARRDRDGGAGRRHDPGHAVAGRAREPGERPRGRQPAARAAGAADQRPARAGRDGRRGVRARRRPARRRARRARAARRRSTRPSAAA